MQKLIVILICTFLIGGCAYASKMNKISLGMSKADVISALGNPASSKGTEGQEVLEYRFYTEYFRYDIEPYWIILEDDKVVKYGRAGDWGTSKPKTYRLEYDDLDK